MSKRLYTAAATLALLGALAGPAVAQTPATATTEAAAAKATGKPSTDAPANTKVQGAAKAMSQAAPAAADAAKPVQATAAAPAAAPMSAAKPVTVNGDLVDTLKLSGQFTTFVGGIDATNLAGLLKTNKNLTVFAPTDAAFAAMPPADLAKLKADKAAMQKFVLRHVVNAPIDSTKIKGAKGAIDAGSQEKILLDGSDEAGTLKVGGATIVQADLKTGSGLLHVVDKTLAAGGDEAAAPAPTAAAPTGAAAPTAGAAATQPSPR